MQNYWKTCAVVLPAYAMMVLFACAVNLTGYVTVRTVIEIIRESFAIVMMASDEGLTACAVMETLKAVVLMTCVKMLMACGVVLKTCAIALMAYTKAMTAFAIRNRAHGMC